MTQKEIFEIEKDNSDLIYLYREGIFWKAYERSAFHLVCRTGKLKPVKKYIKTIKQEIVSVGFPCTVLNRYVSEEPRLFLCHPERSQRICFSPDGRLVQRCFPSFSMTKRMCQKYQKGTQMTQIEQINTDNCFFNI